MEEYWCSNKPMSPRGLFTNYKAKCVKNGKNKKLVLIVFNDGKVIQQFYLDTLLGRDGVSPRCGDKLVVDFGEGIVVANMTRVLNELERAFPATPEFPTILARAKFDSDTLESADDWILNNREACLWLLVNEKPIKKAYNSFYGLKE